MRYVLASLLLAGCATLIFAGLTDRPQYDLVNGDPALPTNGERWTRLCRVEAPTAVAECVDRYALRFVFERGNAAHEAAVRAVR